MAISKSRRGDNRAWMYVTSEGDPRAQSTTEASKRIQITDEGTPRSSDSSWISGLGEAASNAAKTVRDGANAAQPEAPAGSGSAIAAQAAEQRAIAPDVTRADLNNQAPNWSYNGQAPNWSYNGGMTNWDPATDAAYNSAMDALRAAKANLPNYTDSYGDDIASLYQQITGRGPFKYDLENDPLYQQYRAQYTNLGQQAMRDTMGQAAGLTGGYGSSYGQAVGQQQYNAYLGQLNNIIPDLYDRAYNAWLNEGDQLSQQISTARALQGDEYGRYRDAMSDYYTGIDYANADVDRAYNRGLDYWNRDYALESDAYNRATDAYTRDLNAEETAYQRASDQWARDYQLYGDAQQRQGDEYNRLMQMMQMGYTPTEEDLIAAGMTGAEAQTWLDYIAQQNAAAAAGGGGGGSSAATGSGATTPKARQTTLDEGSSGSNAATIEAYARQMAAGNGTRDANGDSTAYTDSQIKQMIDDAASAGWISHEEAEELKAKRYIHGAR